MKTDFLTVLFVFSLRSTIFVKIISVICNYVLCTIYDICLFCTFSEDFDFL